jgi:hypothetical protein
MCPSLGEGRSTSEQKRAPVPASSLAFSASTRASPLRGSEGKLGFHLETWLEYSVFVWQMSATRIPAIISTIPPATIHFRASMCAIL